MSAEISESTKDEPTTPERRRPSRRTMTLIAIPLIILTILGYIGDGLFPSLVDDHPTWLLVLNPRNRNLAFIATQLDAVTYYSLGAVRLLLTDPIWFLIGYWYGDAAVSWMEKRTRTWGDLLRQAQGWFDKAAYPLVFIAPNNFICMFAGAAGMSIPVFLVLNVSGTFARLWFFDLFGEAFQEEIDGVAGWIGDHRMILLPISIGLVLLSIALEAKRGETEIGSLTHLEDELEEEESEAERS